MGTSPAGTTRTTLLFIGGTSRSGSTLLECLLARLDNVVVLGEVAHLWRRGVMEDQLCACGASFSSCPFWQEVGDRAFGGWEQVDVPRVLQLMDAVDRQRRIPQTARRRPSPKVAAMAEEYAEHYRKIYDAAREISGAEVVVDSSKVPPTALALSHDPRIDLRVLHIVRDSRGVAYSWTKVVPRPETETGEDMPRFGVRKSTALWLSHNLSISALSYRGFPVTRIRYEDLVADASTTVRSAWQRLELPGPGVLPMIDRTTVELVPTHSVAGNPMRFSLGTTTLRPDVAWRSAMPAHERRVVTALTYPVLRAMGYR